jgi:hypothetical protein
VIRVFPRKTNWTPTDKLAVVGDPRIPFLDQSLPVRISVTFTWDIPEGERLYRSWRRYYDDVELGGPAFGDPGGEFVPGRFLKQGVTVTSRGCSKECAFCLAWKREGRIRELLIHDGWDVNDNNLLACSRKHIENVFDMLRRQPERIKFSGGLDADFLDAWHVDELKTLRLEYAWFACDYTGALQKLERVADLMADFTQAKKRCYVLIGYNGESLPAAEKRLEAVFRLGFLPFAMLYRSEENKVWPREWRLLQKKWCRPAAFKAHMKLIPPPSHQP